MEKNKSEGITAYTTFINLEKAYDKLIGINCGCLKQESGLSPLNGGIPNYQFKIF